MCGHRMTINRPYRRMRLLKQAPHIGDVSTGSTVHIYNCELTVVDAGARSKASGAAVAHTDAGARHQSSLQHGDRCICKIAKYVTQPHIGICRGTMSSTCCVRWAFHSHRVHPAAVASRKAAHALHGRQDLLW